MRSPRFYLSKDTCVKNYNIFFFILRLKTERNFTFSSYCMVIKLHVHIHQINMHDNSLQKYF